MIRLIVLFSAALVLPVGAELKIATFDLDATPPAGSRLTYDPMSETGELTLRCRGVVLTGSGEPIVLCAVDWIGIANEAHDAFRDVLAKAAGTTRERVAVHALHQHDAPMCDFAAEKLLLDNGQATVVFDSKFARTTIERAAAAVEASLSRARPLTHAGFGRAEVREVASTRRILGPDGKIKFMRMTACKDPAVRAQPEGTIDPFVAVVGLWSAEQPVAVLSYYATHPQSFYRTGVANPDFPGIARFLRQQAVPGALHVHFTGAGGNVGAGKYNDGSPANRPVLAARLADGMKRAWEARETFPIQESDLGWRIEPVALPPAAHLDAAQLQSQVSGTATTAAIDQRLRPATRMVESLSRRTSHRPRLPAPRSGPHPAHARANSLSNINSPHRGSGPTCAWPWLRMAITAPVTSAPRSPTPRAATKPSPPRRSSPPPSRKFSTTASPRSSRISFPFNSAPFLLPSISPAGVPWRRGRPRR